MNPFFTWMGGKRCLCAIILSLFPARFDRYIEVFGTNNWTSIANFEEKINHNNLFKNFIPSFKYGIISLYKLTFQELKQKETEISFEMLLLKIRDGNDLSMVQGILNDENYTRKILNTATEEQKQDIVKILERQLEPNNASDKQRQDILGNIKDGGVDVMRKWFDMQEVEQRGIEQGKEEQLKETVFKFLKREIPNEEICEFLEIDEDKLEEIKTEYDNLESVNELGVSEVNEEVNYTEDSGMTLG